MEKYIITVREINKKLKEKPFGPPPGFRQNSVQKAKVLPVRKGSRSDRRV
jgi:hypothetical protein